MDIVQLAAQHAHEDFDGEPAEAGQPRPDLLDVTRRALRGDDRATERALVAHSIRGVTTVAQRRRLVAAPGLAAVVRVPTAAWVGPVARILRGSAEWGYVYEAPVQRRRSAEDTHDRTIANALAQGMRLLGISPDPERLLPPTLVSACDLRIDVAFPDADLLAAVVRSAVGRRHPLPMESYDATGLDLPDIVAAIRLNSTPVECLVRLERARASRLAPDPGVADAPRLADLHGYGEAMAWCQDLLRDLAEWRAGRTPFPNGSARAVLAGPPGTGKTQLVRSLAREAGMPLVATSMASWFTNSSGNLDGVLRQVDALWERARAVAPAVVLIDELDALPNRAGMEARDRTWWTPVVTHVLLSLDGACSGVTDGLVVVGCTNHVGMLDEALVRPGRLERVIQVRTPDDPVVREAIMRSHLGGDLAGEDLSPVALATAGAMGADLMALVRDARRRARVAGRPLGVVDLMALAAPPVRRTPDDDRTCAVHEAGHAVVATMLGLRVTAVSLVETATYAGTVTVDRGRPGAMLRAGLEREVSILLAGLAAEQVVLGVRSAGGGGSPTSDLAQATAILACVHGEQGLGRTLSYVPCHVGRLAPHVAEAVEHDLQRLFRATMTLLASRRDALERVTARLLVERVLSGDVVRGFLGEPGPAVEGCLAPKRPRRPGKRRPPTAG
ncbi:AAA family ATPase [Lichenibacterium dinghuense]|uniref:AAA family ATPase n=1 Tax=Lichenibacterium dinghuense TaxID=2895977 RepID=UPI001F00288A|nr:AAA family ATPase [Lichenibacterium sp. 6Y81]